MPDGTKDKVYGKDDLKFQLSHCKADGLHVAFFATTPLWVNIVHNSDDYLDGSIICSINAGNTETWETLYLRVRQAAEIVNLGIQAQGV
jgi:hypothetical protein